MKKYQVVASYVISFSVLLTAVVFSIVYLVNIFESTRPNYRSETIYLTHGDSLRNFYSAAIPEKPVTGMLVLNSATLSPDGYRLAAEKGLIVVSATPVAHRRPTLAADTLVTFRRIVAAAAKRYRVSEERIMVGDFSKNDTAYVTCKKARNRFTVASFSTMQPLTHDSPAKGLVDESGLISWAASVFAKDK